MLPSFLITIDTEGDDLWSRPREVSTTNARFLPRFQRLCEQYRLKPTYLTNFEMATTPDFVELARDALTRNTAEIGMHLHAWDTPPFYSLTSDDSVAQPYLPEYPVAVMREKIAFMTRLLEETFNSKILSHRAGRWGFDARYARLLVEHGYIVDCSVTPHVSWSDIPGNPEGSGGPDYSDFPEQAYWLDLEDIARPGASPLLELPVTIRCASKEWRTAAARITRELRVPESLRRPLLGVTERISPSIFWLRPNGRNRNAMQRLTDQVLAEGTLHCEFVLHSSELMPGGSPTFRSERQIESLYTDMEALFDHVSGRFQGRSLVEHHVFLTGSNGGHAQA